MAHGNANYFLSPHRRVPFALRRKPDMVVQNGFKIEIVDANNTQRSFPEHCKDGKTYVEAEPDAEYFISVQKIGPVTSSADRNDMILEICVDGQCLGWKIGLYRWNIDKTPHLYGLCTVHNGIRTSTALKFVKPSICPVETNSSASPSPLVMTGKIKCYIFEADIEQRTSYSSFSSPRRQRNYRATMEARPVNVPHGSGENFKRKNTRSEAGSVTLAKVDPISPASPSSESEDSSLGSQSRSPTFSFKKGDLVATINLNYCSALGLIHVGVLPKPDVYTHHAMLTGKKRDISRPPIVTPKRIRIFNTVSVNGSQIASRESFRDLFDLTILSSEDENG